MKGTYTDKENNVLYPELEDKIEITVGEYALKILADEKFQAEWERLYQSCYWATVFQNATFINAWYKLYKKHYIPILITSYRGDKLTGLLNLCMSLKKLMITGTGADDAHYHTWLAEECNKETFITNALVKVREHFRGYTIRLYQLPQHTPLNWLKTDRQWEQYTTLKTFERPLVDLTHPDLPKLYSKKQFRENRNRLKRLGEVTFEHLTSTEQLEAVFDQMIDQYDFRKGATLNLLPFRTDPLKKSFYLDLFRLNIFHVAVLKMNNEVVASLIATIGKDGWAHGAGINTHAPNFALYSPGFTSFILLAQQLASGGYKMLDLSTGDQEYKKRITNTQDQVYELIIRGKPKPKAKLPGSVKKLLLQNLSKAGLNYPLLKAKLRRNKKLFREKWQLLSKQGMGARFAGALQMLLPAKNEKIFKIACNNTKISSKDTYVGINRNSISDLLQFTSGRSLKTRWEFLEEAMFRLELGEQAFTWTEGNNLKACIWLSSNSKRKNIYAAKLQYPAALVLHGLYYQPECKHQLAFFLAAAAAEVKSSQPQEEEIYLVATPSDAALCGISTHAVQPEKEYSRYATA